MFDFVCYLYFCSIKQNFHLIGVLRTISHVLPTNYPRRIVHILHLIWRSGSRLLGLHRSGTWTRGVCIKLNTYLPFIVFVCATLSTGKYCWACLPVIKRMVMVHMTGFCRCATVYGGISKANRLDMDLLWCAHKILYL